MSLNRRRGLIASMENYEEPTVVETLPVNDTQDTIDPELGKAQPEQPKEEVLDFPEGSESPEAVDADLKEAEAEVVSIENEIDQALDVIDQIEHTSEIVERAAENGGLNQTGAELLNASLEGLMALVGFDKEDRYTPSLESFGGTGSRVRATNVTLENMKEKARAIWDAIVKAISTLMAKIKQVYQHVTDKRVRYKSRVAKLRELLDKVPDTPAESSITNARIASAVAVGNNVPSNMGAAIGDIDGVVQLFTSLTEELTSKLNTKFINLVKSAPKIDEAVFSRQVDELFEEMPAGNNIFSDGFSKVLLGNRKLQVDTKKKLGIITVVKEEAQAPSETLRVMNKGELKAALDACDTVLDKLDAIVKQQDKRDQYVRNAQEAVKANVDATDDSKVSIVRNAVMLTINAVNSGPRAITQVAIEGVGAALAYAELSLKAYQKKEEKVSSELATV